MIERSGAALRGPSIAGSCRAQKKCWFGAPRLTGACVPGAARITLMHGLAPVEEELPLLGGR